MEIHSKVSGEPVLSTWLWKFPKTTPLGRDLKRGRSTRPVAGSEWEPVASEGEESLIMGTSYLETRVLGRTCQEQLTAKACASTDRHYPLKPRGTCLTGGNCLIGRRPVTDHRKVREESRPSYRERVDCA